MLGGHIDANSDMNGGSGSGNTSSGRRVSYMCNTLRYALAGGVFRWLQISAGLDFERRAQVRHHRHHPT
jgi:cytidylate kinase